MKKHRIVVLGGGESGYGSAVLAKVKEHEVFLSDSGTIQPEYAAILDSYGVPYEQGGHTEDIVYQAELVIKSPGIPDTAPIIEGLHERGIPIVSEIEFAGRYTRGKCICVSGSNGKTTTTTLIYEILRNAGYDVGLAGNIGKSFAYTVATEDKEWYVIELSSFQLDGMYYFKADIAVLMNITPDHLDRYDHDFRKYARSKMRIIRNQGPEDYFILWSDDKVIPMVIADGNPSMKWLPFSSVQREAQGAYLDTDGIITAIVDNRNLRVDTSLLKIKGLHNVYNVMAAAMAGMAAGVRSNSILSTIYDFGGVEHRMEYVAEKAGIEYINDSKATNVDSAWYALESMTRPVVWIAGGTDKGNNYSPLQELARSKVKALVCMGADNSKLLQSFSGVVNTIYDTHSMEEAVKICAQVAVSGDTVLLSPACASFDLFKNYEDRGRQFRDRVLKLDER